MAFSHFHGVTMNNLGLISSLEFKLVEFKEGQKPTDLYDKKEYKHSNYIGGIND